MVGDYVAFLIVPIGACVALVLALVAMGAGFFAKFILWLAAAATLVFAMIGGVAGIVIAILVGPWLIAVALLLAVIVAFLFGGKMSESPPSRL